MTKPRVTLVYGQNGTGKTSFVVSGSDPLEYAELDAGSADRAFCLNPELLHVAKFYSPLTSLQDIGRLSTTMVGATGKGAVQVVHRLSGWREKYSEFINWYLGALEGNSPVVAIDTETKLWQMARNALRQRIQDEVPAAMQGDRLKRLEYEEPNSQFHSLIEAAKASAKSLYIVAHEKNKWVGGEPTSDTEPDGWNEVQDEVDVILRFTIEARKTVAQIKKGPLELLDMKIPEPTIARLDGLLVARDAIVRDGSTPVPSDYEMVVKLAASL